MVIGIAAVALCAWCGWASGFHRTTAAAEVTWLVTVVAVDRSSTSRCGVGATVDGSAGASNRSATHGRATAAAEWVRRSAASRRGWRSSWWCSPGRRSASIRGPHQYHLTISALAQAYRPLNAALLLVWVLVGIGYEVARCVRPLTRTSSGREMRRALATGGGRRGHGAVGPPPLTGPAAAGRARRWGSRSGLRFPLRPILIDMSARALSGRRADAERNSSGSSPPRGWQTSRSSPHGGSPGTTSLPAEDQPRGAVTKASRRANVSSMSRRVFFE